jgi:LmbE family N-acetylglucosaminyl deacetylase
MVSIYDMLIVLLVALVVAAALGRSWFHRRLRRPELLRRICLVAGSTLLVTNLACVFLEVPELWGTANLTLTLGGLASLGVALKALHTGGAPARQPRRVLAIGAHPDDLELACGGTLAKFVDSGHEVQGLVMSDGTRGGDARERSLDAQRGAAFMGLTGMTHHNFTDTELSRHSQEMVDVIEAAMARFNPDIILTHSNHDQHQDHQAVHMATLRAARQHHSILCYESPSATRDFSPSVFIDIDDYVDAKVQAVKMHSDQLTKPYMTPERVRGIASFRGGQAKRRVAEAYEPVRLLSTEMEKL